jgi:hypothetical protein
MILLFLALQSATLPPANLPPPGTVEAAVMAPVNATLAAIGAKDGAAILAQTAPGGSATSVADGKVNRMSWPEMAERFKPGGPRFEEVIFDPAIDVDGDIAMVWARYVFRIDGKTHHCGVDHFDLIRSEGRWRLLNITWSSRTTGCGE